MPRRKKPIVFPKPRILISTGRRNEASRSGEIQPTITGCNLNYVYGILRAGGAPLMVPRIADDEAIRVMVEIADGLLLTGGGDVSSLEYGEEPHPAAKYQDPVRDACERILIRYAYTKNIPILGICRGIQILNVALGGTLVQDIPTQVENAHLHYCDPLHPGAFHTVEIEPGSRMFLMLGGAATLSVNSYHHQSLDRVADALRVVCRARDGVVEAVESAEGRPILALQWHPEEIAAEYPIHQGFFNWLIQQANVKQAAAAPKRRRRS